MNRFSQMSCMEATLHEDHNDLDEESECSRFELFNYLPHQSTTPSPKALAEAARRREEELLEERWDAVVVQVSDWFNHASEVPVEPFHARRDILHALVEQDASYELPICREELDWIGYEASRVLKEFTPENGYPDHLICLMVKAAWGLIQTKDGKRRALTFHEPDDFEGEEPDFDAFKIRVIENRLSLAYAESCIRMRKQRAPQRGPESVNEPAPLRIYVP